MNENVERAKFNLHYQFPGEHHVKIMSLDLENGSIVAVLIASEIFQADVWFSFRQEFDPQDGKAIFYWYELEILKNKTPEQLRDIHKAKLIFGPRSKLLK